MAARGDDAADMRQLRKPYTVESEGGVAEPLAAVLLIAVIALGIGALAVALFSQQPPPVLPSVTFDVSYSDSGSVAIRHDGGETIPRDQLQIYIDNGTVVQDNRAFYKGDEGENWTNWSIGDILTYTPPEAANGPQKAEVLMVYSDLSGGEYLLHASEGWKGQVPGTAGSLDFIVDENVFIYGNTLEFNGDTINGPGATAVILGGLTTDDLNGGASIAVSNLYIGGDVNLDGGSASLGSAQNPGSIYVDGNLRLWSGGRNIYGTVYVNGNFDLKDARIHGNVYVNGNLTLGWTPTIADDARIYYTGTLTAPNNYDSSILAKCIHQATVPGFEMPDWEIPPTKPQTWYTERGYIQGGTLTSNMKVFAPAYSSTSSQHTANNVIIVAYDGDITITGLGGSGVTGVFIAPKGRVTFNGAFLEGVVIARNGFFVTSGGTTVTFRNLSDLITDPADYPL